MCLETLLNQKNKNGVEAQPAYSLTSYFECQSFAIEKVRFLMSLTLLQQLHHTQETSC